VGVQYTCLIRFAVIVKTTNRHSIIKNDRAK